MRRFTKKRIAIASVLLVALVVLLAVALDRRPTGPSFRFLENHVPVVHIYDYPSGHSSTVYEYEFDADFDSVAKEAAQELTAAGFTLFGEEPKTKFVEFRNADQRVVIDGFVTGTAPGQAERVNVHVVLPPKPPLWERLISRIYETLSLSERRAPAQLRDGSYLQ
jgi:hypothetical protein